MAVVKQVGGGKLTKKKKGARVRAEAPVSSDYSLPGEMSEPATSLGDLIILLHGERKIGKTTLATKFDHNLLLAAEVGYKGLRSYVRDVLTWMDAKQYLRLLKKDKTFHTVTLDTGDKFYGLAERFACDELGIDHPNDEGFGKGWSYVRKTFDQWLNALAATGKGVLVISHSAEREVTQRDGGKYDRLMPTLPKQAYEIIASAADIIAYYGYDGRRRVLQILGDDYVVAGHRLAERFRTPDGRRIRCIDMGKTPEEGHKNFIDAFNNRYTPAKEEWIEAVKTKKVKTAKRKVSLG